MKKIAFTLVILISSITLFSQTNTPETSSFGIKFGGFVREDAIFDTRQVEQLREGMFLFYPLNTRLDKAGDDINARSSFNLFAIGARLSGAITGPDAFGAKTSGLLEGEFFGATNANINTLRLRHAFVKLNWSKTELLVGQTWHALFTEECVPNTLNFNTGSPFQPFNRSPQVRIKQSLGNHFKLTFSTVTQRDFTSTGPAGAGYQYLANAATPEFTLGISYTKPKTDSSALIGFGLVGEYKVLQPRLVTDSNVCSTQKIETFGASAYFQIETKRMGLKVKATYGENLYDQLMLGGYAIRNYEIKPADGDWQYTSIACGAIWGDLFVNFGKANLGFFGGYTQNFGANNNIYSWTSFSSTTDNPFYSRGVNIAYVCRMSPRISYTIGKVKIGLEYDYTLAAYGNKLNSLGVIVKTADDPTAKITQVANSRILGMIQYNF
ncbi:MAG: hypothetical protein WCP69_03000 [Bacteroidota bacterium]